MSDASDSFDVVVIGAGAAGMMCAAVAGQRGRRVLIVDHSVKLAEKIRISGGGRCNFTNRDAGPQHYLSQNPHFVRSALSRYGAADFIDLVRRAGIPFHEKHKGQLFCDNSAEDIIGLLQRECDAGAVAWRKPCKVHSISRSEQGFTLENDGATLHAQSLVVATGGLSIPKIGATDFGYQIAKQFGLKRVETRPALVPLTFSSELWKDYVALAGSALPVRISTGEQTFDEDLLFTHRGLSGPAILQISSYWKPNTPIEVDLAPGEDLAAKWIAEKSGSRDSISTLLKRRLSQRQVDMLLSRWEIDKLTKLADCNNKRLQTWAAEINAWRLTPSGSEGYAKAEVTLGGVSTQGLNQSTLEAKAVKGLYFIGEVVDVTGWLGGYNFQWAWSSGFVAGSSV